MEPSAIAVSQYASTSDKLAQRLAIHDWNTSDQGWFAWAGDRIVKVGDVLEVGAGTGELWRRTPHPDARLTLTDFSAAMCENLRGVPGAEVRQCDATALPFPDQSFDSVVANHMLYHVDDPDAALAEFARELLNVGAEVGRPSVIRDRARVVAETAAKYLEKHFTDVTWERCPGAFEVPKYEPVLAYINSIGDEPLGAEAEAKARRIIEDTIAEEGRFRVNKHMVLFTGRRV
ncbi:unnamed protein product [Parascedosporium putredinis]|uniref:Methyltransferase type 11 domain-containing protein n=1 Tax=Parascedosporium putredinis TaxID=1442378 RepID=A0A9P1GVX7_9PEZI|nr:unnamed protein product [Parascedosporium putredinis]CAI7988004.1 unnamed protein product [Parascedosporium putredinis]